MNDFVSSFYESILERFKPLLTLPRLAYYIFMLLITSPSAENLFSVATLTLSIHAVTQEVISQLQTLPFWVVIVVGLAVFVAIPLVTAFIVRLFVRGIHLSRAQKLIDNLVNTLSAPESEVRGMKQDQISALYHRKNNALVRLERYKAFAELLIYLLVAVILSFALTSISGFRCLASLVVLLWLLYVISQRMFFCYLVDIKPYDVVAQRLNLLT